MTLIDGQRSKEIRSCFRGTVLEGLSARDFDRLAASLAPDVQMRTLLPPGPTEWAGSQDVAETFRSWRLRVWPTPFGIIGDGCPVIEQQAYADAAVAIDTLDLLCSGFHAEPTRDAGD